MDSREKLLSLSIVATNLISFSLDEGKERGKYSGYLMITEDTL